MGLGMVYLKKLPDFGTLAGDGEILLPQCYSLSKLTLLQLLYETFLLGYVMVRY